MKSLNSLSYAICNNISKYATKIVLKNTSAGTNTYFHLLRNIIIP